MLTIGNYVKVKTLEEAYELNQARNSRIMGGMMWMRLGNARVKTIIDMSDLGLNEIEETDHVFRIGAMCTLSQLEEHEGLRKFYGDGIAESLRHIVGVQFRNQATLVKDVENIVGIKEASGNISTVAQIMHLCDGNVDLYSGNDDQVVPLLALGGIGVISVLSNVAPTYVHDMCYKFFSGDIAGSRKMQLDALPLIDALFCEVNPIPVKAALNMMGKEVGTLRAPLTEMEDAHKEVLKKAMIDLGIL